MSCEGGYSPDDWDKKLSVVACLLDELDGIPTEEKYWRGYHPSIYCKTVDGDAFVAKLCSRLQSVDVTKLSLEMQTWWRDHQAADRVRLCREMSQQKFEAEWQAAVEKLTPYERNLLGL
ncbi:MAG: hypothetical protein ACKO0Z_27765 [Betaproteobacteria bacterium]